MIIIKNISVHIAGQELFEKVSFVLHKGDKVGIVGPNGAGKSTLLKVIIGEVELDNGAIRVEKERIGYLPQETESNSQEKLSGGQKTRLALDKIFADKPTMLILDEPTNHLDLKAVEWLEKIIKEFKGGVLIVSHDRRLLDNTISKILEIDPVNTRFNEYMGNYSNYIKERNKKLDLQEIEYKQQQREKERIENWIILKRQEAKIFSDPRKGKMIRAKEKYLQREIYDKEIVRPSRFKKIRGVDLNGEVANAKLVCRYTTINKSYGERKILNNISFEIRGKERVLLSGDNGSGKTTLLRILIGKLKPDSGEVKIGVNISIGYFSQEHETLNQNKTVLEEFLDTPNLISQKDPRQILGAFLFSDHTVFKKVSSLSLGERVRLIFAKLTNQQNELLVLDEPTNHLDIQSREVIEQALNEYQGAIILVSHDRYFVDKIGINRNIHIHNGYIKND